MLQVYPDGLGCVGMLWHFYNSIDMGDEIIALGARTRVLGIGTVTRGAFHDEALARRRVGIAGDPKVHFIGVAWHTLRPIQFSGQLFPRRTVSEVQLAKYAEVVKQAGLIGG